MSSKSEMKSAQEEIKGLKHIVRELQAEASRLESENKMLIGEMEELRQVGLECFFCSCSLVDRVCVAGGEDPGR